MKNAALNRNKNLKGVSTLDLMKRNLKILLLFLILTTFGGAVYGGHSTLDKIDPGFNPEIETSSYGGKQVQKLEVLPDGKILVFGFFSSYNRMPVGRLVRLNPDGSLDPTFNHQTITSSGNYTGDTNILIQPDGKIVVINQDTVADEQPPKPIVRLNPDGTLDTSFNFPFTSQIRGSAIDSLGRIAVAGSFSTPQGKRIIIRLNADGSLDNSFNFVESNGFTEIEIAAQGSRLLTYAWFSNIGRKFYRLNEDGSVDTSFMPSTTGGIFSQLTVQPDNKILYASQKVYRLNENGSNDDGFQPINIRDIFIKVAADGKIITRDRLSISVFRRFLPNGAEDTSFSPYTHRVCVTYTLQPDGSILIGDATNLNDATVGINNFIRLTPLNGAPDPTFNSGGIGFQNILPGSIQAIEPLADGKVLLGGKFDVINDIYRPKIARLNADSMVDESFEINTSGTGNHFSLITNIYQIRAQADGKIVVSGWFNYVQDGVEKRNLVRLNSDGSIDPTFNLTETINDWSEIVGAGRNPLITFSDGKLIIGISRLSGFGPVGPLKFNQNGSRNTSFTSMLNNQSPNMFIDDLAMQPDGKILVSGSHDPDHGGHRSFIARLNADGSLDSTFPYTEETGRLRRTLALLPNGKILVGKHSNVSLFGRVERLNADGTPDNTFNALSIPNGIINALLVLPNGKIFVGGKFTVSINEQKIRNLLRLDADGNIESTAYNLNEEVLTLAVDGEGRLLVGGSFTVIETNSGDGANRTDVARLTDSRRFDFDGDGRSDVGVFSDADGVWKILGNQTNQDAPIRFGLSGDKTTAADFDGDGRADIAVFRPSDGIWYLLRSRDGFIAQRWGTSGDMPITGDFDGDGRADLTVFRPSNAVWYISPSSNQQPVILKFGLTGDIPLPEVDFDGDGKTDIAVWRPSDGNFYWLASGSANQFFAVHFGTSGDIPAAADYNGDGKTDLVVYRPAEGNWYQYLSAPDGGYTFSVTRFGLNSDMPVPADYDGDGETDIAVRRENVWHILRSTEGYAAFAFAEASDTALAAMLLP